MADSFGAADMSWRDALTDKVGVSYQQEEDAKGKFNYLTTVVPPYIFVLKLVAGSPLCISAIVSGGLTAWFFSASSGRRQRTGDKGGVT